MRKPAFFIVLSFVLCLSLLMSTMVIADDTISIDEVLEDQEDNLSNIPPDEKICETDQLLVSDNEEEPDSSASEEISADESGNNQLIETLQHDSDVVEESDDANGLKDQGELIEESKERESVICPENETVHQIEKAQAVDKLSERNNSELDISSTTRKISSVILKYSSMKYTGKARTQTNTTTVKANVNGKNRVLKKGVDYSISYKNNVNAGTATIIVKGKGSYTGTIKRSFKITPVNLKSATIKYKTKAYTGKRIKQTSTTVVKATVNGKTRTLKNGTDYSISYKNNVKAGTATMIIKGKGNFAGTITKTFKIIKPALPKDSNRAFAGWYLETVFNHINRFYGGDDTAWYTSLTKNDISEKTWGRILSLYVGMRWVKDARLTYDNNKSVINTSYKNIKKIVKEITGVNNNAAIERILSYTGGNKNGSKWSMSTVALIGQASYYYFNSITEVKRLSSGKLQITGTVEKLRNMVAHPQTKFIAVFTPSALSAPWPWRLESLTVNGGNAF